MRHGTTLVSLALVSTMIVGACSSNDQAAVTSGGSQAAPATDVVAATDDPTTNGAPVTTEGAPTRPTPWSEAVDAFDAEGTPDVVAALTLFTMAFGPIDGFPVPPADSGASGDVTVAFRAVAGVWDQITPAQRDVVMNVLTGVDDNSTETVLALRAPARRAKPDQALVDAINVAAVDIRATIAGRIGDFKGTLKVIVTAKDDAKKDLGTATPTINADGSFSGGCTLRIFPNALSTGAERLLNTIAHEVFHCFQFAGFGSLDRWAGAPGWVVEGGAEWVGAIVTSPDDTTPGRWKKYFGSPKVSLRLRDYDAIAFWSHLAETGTDPWSVFRAVWATSGTAAAFAASGANTPAFLDSWASGATRDPARGAGWDTDGPGITDDSVPVSGLTVPDNGAVPASVGPYAISDFVIASSADVFVFTTVTGHARLSDARIDTTELAGARFCNRPGGCACPNVTDDIPPSPIADGPVLALSGGPEGTSVAITGMPLEEHCEEKEKRPVQVTQDRPASEGVLAGQILELTSCNGAHGDWSGVLRLGGLSLDGFEVALQEIPLAFTVGGAGTVTVPAAAAGTIDTPVFDLEVAYDLSITVDGSTMTIVGNGSGTNDMFTIEQAFPAGLTGMPIVPAPPGVCPEG
jgi:hypothetical protein